MKFRRFIRRRRRFRPFLRRHKRRLLTSAGLAFILAAGTVAGIWWRRYFVQHGHHPTPQYGNIADWTVALLTLAAVCAALVIASRDRRTRMQERAEQDKAQARFVLLRVKRAGRQWTVRVTNHGAQPVLDICMGDGHLRDLRLARSDDEQPKTYPHVNIETGGDYTDLIKPILLPGESTTFVVDFVDADTDEPFFKATPNGPWQPDAETYAAEVTVSFVDANGGLWNRFSTGEVMHSGWKLP
jgi:hypothetical protein